MNSDSITRYLQRLPTLITFFFSIMLVTFYREISTLFHLTTGPTFDFRNLADDLILIGFLATLFFVVSVWLAYSLLIERYPYTLDYSVFFFDVLRFSVLYVIFSFAFLAGNPPFYGYYLLMLGVFHLLMAGWHSYRLRSYQEQERVERTSDIRGHLFRMASYFALAIIYYIFVARTWQSSSSWSIHALLVVTTSVLLVYWNIRRLAELKMKVQKTQEAAKSQVAAVPSK